MFKKNPYFFTYIKKASNRCIPYTTITRLSDCLFNIIYPLEQS